jgi:hypothetical protein
MDNIQIIGNINNTDVINRYSSEDISLIGTQEIQEFFNPKTDYIEYYVYDKGGNLLNVEYIYDSFKLPNDSALTPSYVPVLNTTNQVINNLDIVNSAPSNTGSSFTYIEIDPVNDLKNLSYTSGEFRVQYNFLKNKISNSNSNYFLKRISPDRTEISITSTTESNLDIETVANELINEFNSSLYFTNYLLNFGLNRQFVTVNIALDKIESSYEILFKLYEPLPSDISEKSLLWVVEEKVNPYIFDINLDTLITPPAPLMLRGANFNISVKQDSNKTSTQYSNYNNLVSSIQSTQKTTYQKLLNTLTSKSIDINVDYTSFDNFSFFGSTEERLNGFYSKVKEIEDYNNLINSYSSSASLNPSLQLEINRYSSSINNIISNFDGYETFLYYESSSLTWPKSNSVLPYTLYSTSSISASVWFNNIIESASLFDEYNPNNLKNTIPTYLIDDSSNNQYILFLNMIGHYFDNIWILLKSVTDINLSNNNLEQGISKDLVYHTLKSLGINLFNSLEGEDLEQYLVGNNTGSYYLSGSLTNFSPTSSYLNNIPKRNLVAEIYKRIYHNLPLLVKTKGTTAGLQNIVTMFGVTSSILSVKEYGGTLKQETLKGYSKNKIRLSNNNPTGSVLSPITTIQQLPTSSNDYLDNDLQYIDVSFSPQTQIDLYISRSISSVNSNWDLDDYIGDPRQQYLNNYPDLDNEVKTYFEQGTGSFAPFTSSYLDYSGFIRLIQFFDNSLFKTLESFVPARTSLSTGVTFNSPVLERNKFAYSNPNSSSLENTLTAEYNTFEESSSLVISEGGTGGVFEMRPIYYYTSSTTNIPGGTQSLYSTSSLNLEWNDYASDLNETIWTSSLFTDNYTLAYITGSIFHNEAIYQDFEIRLMPINTLLWTTGSSGIGGIYNFNLSSSISLNDYLLFSGSQWALSSPESSSFLTVNVYTSSNSSSVTTITQSGQFWEETLITPAGNVIRLNTNQSEFYTGQLGGSEIIIYSGSLNSSSSESPLLNNVGDSILSNVRNNIFTPNREFTTIYNNSSYITPAELQDSYLSLSAYVKSRHEGVKVTSDEYNTITSSNNSYGNLAAIDKYTDIFGYFDWIGNAYPEVPNAGNVHLLQLIDRNGNIIDLNPLENKNKFIVENVFKQNELVNLYFIDSLNDSRQGNSGSYSIYSAGGYYDTSLYISNDVTNISTIENLNVPSMNPSPQWVLPTNQIISMSNNIFTWVNRTWEQNPLINQIGITGYTNSMLSIPIPEGSTIYNGDDFKFNTNYFPVKTYDIIRIITTDSFSEETSNYYEEKYVSSANTSSYSYPLFSNYSSAIQSSSVATYNLRIIRKLENEDFVVVNNITSAGPGLIIPKNYNPELNYVQIAKKAGIL